MNSSHSSVMLSLTNPIKAVIFFPCICLVSPSRLILPKNTKLYVCLFYVSSIVI